MCERRNEIGVQAMEAGNEGGTSSSGNDWHSCSGERRRHSWTRRSKEYVWEYGRAGGGWRVEVVICLVYAVFHAHRVVGAALCQGGKHAISATHHSCWIWMVGKADPGSNTVLDRFELLRVIGGECGRGIRVCWLGSHLQVVPCTQVEGQIGPDCPGIFCETVVFLYPEVVFADMGNRVIYLGERGVVSACGRIDRRCWEDILHP